jgi:hypothetical protein
LFIYSIQAKIKRLENLIKMEENIVNVIWGRVKYKWTHPQKYILLQEKVTVYSDKPSESEWVPVGFDPKEQKRLDDYQKRLSGK